MPRWLLYLGLLPGAFATLSMLLYAYTGLTMWEPVPPPPGGANRMMFLTFSHLIFWLVSGLSLAKIINPKFGK